MKRLYCSSDITSGIEWSRYPFVPDTDISYYNDFLNPKGLEYMQRAKNRTGEIVLMSPNEYFHECSLYGFPEVVPEENLRKSRGADRSDLEEYARDIRNGKKYYLPYINYASRSQEGLHRMMVVGDLYGWDEKFPVLTVTVFDQVLEDAWKLHEEISDFNRYEFKAICIAALEEISDWYGPVPENFSQLLRNSIIKVASERGYTIDTDVEVKELDNHDGTIAHQIIMWLTEYNGNIIENPSEPQENWLEQWYDVNGVRSDVVSIDNLLFL